MPLGLIRVLLRLVAAGFFLAARPRCQGQNEPAPPPTAAVDPAAAALAGFDEATGLWFPPDAPRRVYLERSDPNHDLILDMQKAFTANPALREAVCALAADPRREVRASGLDMSVRQRITAFHMLCAGAEAAAREKRRSEDVWQENETRFERARNASSARALPERERRARFLEINADLMQSADVYERLDRAFEMLGLGPQTETALYRVLAVSPFKGTRNEARFHNYLGRLFSRESAEGMPEAGRYRMSMRNHLYFTNRLGEAGELTRGLLGDESLARWKTNNLAVLALLDRLAGDVSALKRVASRCGSPEADVEADATRYVDRPDGAFCFDMYFDLALHDIELNGEAAPAGLVGVLEDVISAEPANWPRRATAIQYVVRLDPARGRELAEELLRIPATIVPLGARLDALDDIATASRKLHDLPRALTALDRYLDFLRYRPAPVPPGVWDRLTALPKEEKGPQSIARRGWLNISWALGEKVATLIDAGDFRGARRAIEACLANALRLAREIEKESGKERLAQLVNLEGLEAREREALETLLGQEVEDVRRAARDEARMTRSHLRSYGVALLKAGRHEEAKRVVGYLIAQPGGEHNLPGELYPIFYGAKDLGKPLPPATSPWEAALDAGGVPPPRRR
ncbi:MAG TPA: hypothetical protein VLJ18_08760 [Thermoanaerobaculia bacterium]|nr:hypothetical protein [Thermoanaerobaculia bacterium]